VETRLHALASRGDDVSPRIFAKCSTFSSTGTGVLAYGLLLYSLLFKGTSIQTAYQISYIPWVYHHVKMILTGGWEDIFGAGSTGPAWVSLATFIFAIYAMSQDYADTAIKALSALWTFSGIQFFLSPVAACGAWSSGKYDAKKRPVTAACTVMSNCFAFYLVAISVTPLSMVMFDASPVEAAGYGALVWGALHAYNILSGTIAKGGFDETKIWSWLALNAVMAAAALL